MPFVFDPPRVTQVIQDDAMQTDVLVLTAGGPPGVPGPPGEMVAFEYQMPVAQTTATITHTLGRDPIAVQVFDPFGVLVSEYDVVFTIPNEQVRIGFDIPVAAFVRLH